MQGPLNIADGFTFNGASAMHDTIYGDAAAGLQSLYSGSSNEHDVDSLTATQSDREAGTVGGSSGQSYYETKVNSDYTSGGFSSNASPGGYSYQNASSLFSTVETDSGPPDTSTVVTYANWSSMSPTNPVTAPSGLSSGAGTARTNTGVDSGALGQYKGAVAYLGNETASSANTSGGLFTALGSRGAATMYVGKGVQVAATADANNTIHLGLANGAVGWSAAVPYPGYRRPGGGGGSGGGGGGASQARPGSGAAIQPAPTDGEGAGGGLNASPSGYTGSPGIDAGQVGGPSPGPDDQTPEQPGPSPFSNQKNPTSMSPAEVANLTDFLGLGGGGTGGQNLGMTSDSPCQSPMISCIAGNPPLPPDPTLVALSNLESSVSPYVGRAIQVGGGVMMVGSGVLGAALTSETGFGFVAGLAVAAKGVDNIQAGLRGEQTMVAQTIKAAGGNETAQFLGDFVTDLGPGGVQTVAKASRSGFRAMAEGAKASRSTLFSGIDPSDAMRALDAIGDGVEAAGKELADAPIKAKIGASAAAANVSNDLLPNFVGRSTNPTLLNPTDVNFSQRTVASNVSQYVADMRTPGGWDWSKSGPLRVMERDGQWVSYDNRRLMAARLAGLNEVPVQVVDPDAMYSATKTWEQAFRNRFLHPKNVRAGGPVPNQGLADLPDIVLPR